MHACMLKFLYNNDTNTWQLGPNAILVLCWCSWHPSALALNAIQQVLKQVL